MTFEYTMGKELDLKKEQDRTLSTPRLHSNLILRCLYVTFDLVYGFKRSLPKFVVLELLARYPYWAWEAGSYHRLSHLLARTTHPTQEEIEKLLRHIEMGREAQDNEQFHMLLLADIIQQHGGRLGWFKHFLVPRILAILYLFLTNAMYLIKPSSSFAMNAAFESHAEREYMLMAKENPQWEDEPVESVYFKYYPKQRSLCDLLRRIALDERDHMNHSLEEVQRLEAERGKS